MMNRTNLSTVLAAAALTMIFAGSAFAQIPIESLTENMQWRNIGPSNMSGRITDIDALEDDYRFVVVASASGGVWKSTNAGTTWEPIFDDYGAASIGAVSIFQPDPDIMWVGTGEPNNRNSVAWGDGIYKTTDGGETFQHMGLEDTHQIARVLTHPTDPDVVFVGAIGHLWGFSGDRGVFKTTDGGRNWERIFFIDEKTGCSDLAMDPTNPDILYAGMYQRVRLPWRYDGGSMSGGIFKSTDGGRTWNELTEGLPPGDTGKIGLAVSRSNPRVIQAFVEAEQAERGADADPADPKSGVYRSEDGGSSWTMMNTQNNRPFYYSHMYINPLDEDLVYLVMGSFMYSDDKGKTVQRMGGGIHGDYHAMWIDPHNKDRFYIGNDGGVSLTHDHSASYIFFDNLCLAQFYAIGVDMRDPYYVYGGLQDNGTWGGPSNSRDRSGILTDHWFNIGGGDGFHAQIDPTDWRTAYVESQGGSISRVNTETRQRTSIRPNQRNVINYDNYVTDEIMAKQEEARWNSPFRFNWSSPIVLSPHNPSTVFFGGNVLFKSVDQGDSWMIISPDLTTDDPVKILRETGGLTSDVTGAENHCSIISVSESPMRAGLIWVGTDDGNVQITLNGGVDWTNVRSNIRGVPDGMWVSRVEASRFEEGTCYLTFDGHRSDVFTPFVFKTTDYGQTWTSIAGNIPDGQVIYVIKEDLRNPNLLFVGTEFACFFTLDGGQTWSRLMNGLPTVAIHDLVIHPRDNDLIVGTHGRGVWILDDLTPLQQYSEEVQDSDAFLFDSRPVTQWLSINRGGSRGHLLFSGDNPQGGAPINFFIKSESVESAVLNISDVSGNLTWTARLNPTAGINQYRWSMRFEPTEEQKQGFIRNLRRTIENLPENVELTRAQRRELAGIDTRLGEALTSEELTQIQQQLSGMMGRGGGGFGGGRGGRGGGLRGPQAGPGIYRITLTVDGESYTSTLTLKADPIQEGGN